MLTALMVSGVETASHEDRRREECAARADERAARDDERVAREGDDGDSDVEADGEGLHLTLHVPDAERFRTVLDDLRSSYDGVAVDSILRTPPESDDTEAVAVDRGGLTARQAEVLATAHEMGYFEYPRESNATEVAESLGIGPSTLAEHLAAAESKLVDQTLD